MTTEEAKSKAYDLCNRVQWPGWGDEVTEIIAEAILEASQPLSWSKEPPKEPGSYWWKEKTGIGAVVVRVHVRPGLGLVAWHPTLRTYKAHSYAAVADFGGEWAGPLKPPD